MYLNLAYWFENRALSKLSSLGVEGEWIYIKNIRIHLFRYQTSINPNVHSKTSSTADKIQLPPLVLVHGLGSGAVSYASFLKNSIPYFKRIIAPSAPGHGMSPNPSKSMTQDELYQIWELLLLQQAEVEPIIILGTSLGGAISLKFALKYPQHVKALILCSPAGAQLQTQDIDYIRANFRMTHWGDGGRFLKTLYHRPPRLWRLFGLFVRANLKRPIIQRFLSNLKAGAGLSPKELNGLKPPTLLFWGGRERILPSSFLDFYRTHLPSCVTFKYPPTFSHCPQLEEPEHLLTEILSWLQEISSEHI